MQTKMFDFLSLRGTNQSFVKPICLIDATAFDFSSREVIGWFAMFAVTEFGIFVRLLVFLLRDKSIQPLCGVFHPQHGRQQATTMKARCFLYT
jgi:hypothetical protein